MQPSEWVGMTLEERERAVREYMFKKFTLDPSHWVICPVEASRWKPVNELKWEGLWMSDGEFDSVIRDTMKAFSHSQNLREVRGQELRCGIHRIEK